MQGQRVKFCICATDLHHINVIKDQHCIRYYNYPLKLCFDILQYSMYILFNKLNYSYDKVPKDVCLITTAGSIIIQRNTKTNKNIQHNINLAINHTI